MARRKPSAKAKTPSKKGKAVVRRKVSPAAVIVPGPRKDELEKKAGSRSPNHKARSAWFQGRTAWPLRDPPIETVIRERNRVERALRAASGTAQWESVGPTNIGGRITSLVCHPTQPDVIWAGAAGGGVWKSPDAGQTWTSLWHRQAVLNVGSLAIDPANPNVLFCGTGEANLSADSYAGVGIYQTKNGGSTWTLLASVKRTRIPSRIGVIAIDPFNSAHLRIGGIGYDRVGPQEAGLGGMYTSLNGGRTWTRESFISQQNYWCHSIVFHPTQPGTIYASFTALGVRNGIWRSTDAGANWTQLTSGLPAPANINRTSLAIALSDPNVLYAQASTNRSRVLGIFRSRDGGNTWQSVGGTHFADEGQMTYGNAIAVHPTNPNHVICGGVDLHLSTNGGGTWQKVTRWNADRGQSNYAHADHHALLMPPAAPGRLYDGNDGGLDVSADGGRTWENRSAGLAVTMYYDLDVAPPDARSFGGGTQDNGTNITTTGSSNDHFEILGGDGGWMVFHPTRANHLYASYYNMHIWRFRASDGWKDISPPAPEAEQNSMWMVFITVDPNTPATVFTGSSRVWRSRNDGTTWTAVSTPLDGSGITAIEVAPADSQRVYVGTENGGFFRSLDGGTTWSENLASAELPGVIITRLETSPSDAAVLFATAGNFGNSHVFRSDDGGTTWSDVDHGRLPNVPHHAVVIPPDDPQSVYVCSDAGVFVSTDLGATWRNLKRNLPNTMVVDLVHHQGDGTLTAATYGRSLWRLKLRP